ncbi:hypothetical protein [Massilia litorea]|uniref:hypothetical protein n=1 Tax=Massilia litorea TaxID=2769491 RepID=UPI0027D94A72|nr:hypothetical protein [Massilia litorea]
MILNKAKEGILLSQRAIFALGAEVRSRLNGIFFALFFAGGAVGSALGAWVYARHGWQAALLTGLAFPAAALVYWTSEWAAERRLTQSAQAPLR